MIAAVVVRYLELSAIAAVVGALALDGLVLAFDAAELAAARRRLRRWTLFAVIVLIVTSTAALVVRAQVMSQTGLVAAIGFVPAVLRVTHFGTIWIARGAGLAVLLGLVLAFASGRAARAAALLLALGVVATTALTGHAADWGDFRLSVLIDWVHVIAAAAWTGGLLALAVVVLTERASWSPATLRTVAARFSTLAGGCLLLVVLSGVYNTVIQLGNVSAFWVTGYGRILTIKLVVFLVLAGFGATNRYLIVPSLVGGTHTDGRLARLMRGVMTAPVPEIEGARLLSRYVRREAVLVLIVFGATAVLGELTPGRHARHLFQHEHHEEGQHDHLSAPDR